MTLFSGGWPAVARQMSQLRLLRATPQGEVLCQEQVFLKSQPITIIMLNHSSDVFCREDFFRKYGTKCAGCQEGIAPSSVVGISGKDWRRIEFEFWRSLFSGAASSRSRLPRRLLPVHSLQQEIGEQCKLYTLGSIKTYKLGIVFFSCPSTSSMLGILPNWCNVISSLFLILEQKWWDIFGKCHFWRRKLDKVMLEGC